MYSLNHYKIDFEKVKTLEDVIKILKALNISFEPNDKAVTEIKEFLISVPKQ